MDPSAIVVAVSEALAAIFNYARECRATMTQPNRDKLDAVSVAWAEALIAWLPKKS